MRPFQDLYFADRRFPPKRRDLLKIGGHLDVGDRHIEKLFAGIAGGKAGPPVDVGDIASQFVKEERVREVLGHSSVALVALGQRFLQPQPAVLGAGPLTNQAEERGIIGIRAHGFVVDGKDVGNCFALRIEQGFTPVALGADL